jgi:hypothetical protein
LVKYVLSKILTKASVLWITFWNKLILDKNITYFILKNEFLKITFCMYRRYFEHYIEYSQSNTNNFGSQRALVYLLVFMQVIRRLNRRVGHYSTGTHVGQNLQMVTRFQFTELFNDITVTSAVVYKCLPRIRMNANLTADRQTDRQTDRSKWVCVK